MLAAAFVSPTAFCAYRGAVHEIGDECAWSSLTNETLNGHTFNIQLEYSNAAHACSDQPTTPTAAR